MRVFIRPFLYRFDDYIDLRVKKWPQRVKPFMNHVTLLGEPVLIVFVIAASIVAFMQGRSRVGLALAAAVVACILNLGLKQFLHRPRPDTLYVSLMRFKSYSFPSGHSFGAAVTYGLLGYFAYKYLDSPIGLLSVLAVTVLIFLIGVSRIYLGAHYASDVLAGWTLGALSLILIISFIF
mgnify:CR=1 FL=1